MFNLVNKAWLFASQKHEGQLDDDGLPYFDNHVRQVADIVRLVTDDENIIAAAFLHDTIEDCNVTYEEIRNQFNLKVADLVMEVTHNGEKDNYGYYFPRLHSKEGIMLKFADRLSNISRMGSWDAARQEHYLKHSKFWKDGSDKPVKVIPTRYYAIFAHNIHEVVGITTDAEYCELDHVLIEITKSAFHRYGTDNEKQWSTLGQLYAVEKYCKICGHIDHIKPTVILLDFHALYGSDLDFCTKCGEGW